MAGTPLEEFTMLMESQARAMASGDRMMLNEGALNSYTMRRIRTGKQMTDFVQGGDEIRDRIFFNPVSDWERYDPDEEFESPNPQTGKDWRIFWSFGKTSLSWTKHEIGLNKNVHTGDYQTTRYKDLFYQKRQNLATSTSNAREAELWARPWYDKMEAAGSVSKRRPFSIGALINEFPNGLPNAAIDQGGDAWPTVMQVDPTDSDDVGTYGHDGITYSKWQNLVTNYTFDVDGTAANSTTDIFTSMYGTYLGVQFDQIPWMEEYSDKTTSPHVILTSLQGLKNYDFALRNNQDTFRGMGQASGSDPAYMKPLFAGVPLDRIQQLETAELYANSDSTVFTESGVDGTPTVATSTSAAYGYTGPRYYFINGERLHFVAHSENYMQPEPVLTPPKQPFRRIQYYDCWDNTYTSSRRSHALMTPSTDTDDA